MILEAQNQFRDDYIKTLPHAGTATELLELVEESNMPKGYKEKFKTWILEEGNTVIRLSAEDRAEHFVNFLGADIKRELNRMISGDSEQDEKLRKLAVRGQLILTSKDGGEHFDSFLTPDQVENADPLKNVFLSTSLRGTTTNISEILDEQTLLEIRKKLLDQHYLVNSAKIENGVVEIDAVSPKNIGYLVKVDIGKAEEVEPLTFKFTNVQGQVRTVLETQLPEQWGQINAGEEMGHVAKQTLLMNELLEGNDRTIALGAAAGAAASTIANKNKIGSQILPFINDLVREEEQPVQSQNPAEMRAKEIGLMPKGSTVPLSDVMASKARLKRQKERKAIDEKREEERYEKYDEDMRKQRAKKLAEKKAQQTAARKGKASSRGTIIKSLIAGGAIVGTTGAAIGLPLFISTAINLK